MRGKGVDFVCRESAIPLAVGSLIPLALGSAFLLVVPVVGGILVFVGLLGLVKGASTSARGLWVAVHGGKISWGHKDVTDGARLLSEGKWHYVPYHDNGIFDRFYTGFLSISTGLFIRFADNAEVRICPGRFSKQSAKQLLENAAEAIGSIPPYLVRWSMSDASEEEVILCAGEQAATIGNDPSCTVVVGALRDSVSCSIDYKEATNEFTIQVLGPTAVVKTHWAPLGGYAETLRSGEMTAIRCSRSNPFDIDNVMFYADALNDELLHSLPMWRTL